MAEEDFTDEAIDRWMRERTVAAPPRFSASVMNRVRQERWRVERYWDLGFNIAVAAGLLLVLGGVLGLIYMTGLVVVGRDAMLLFVNALATVSDQVAPALPAYAIACVLTFSGLGLWWYVENY